MIERCELNFPFEVIHIDAHADLGLGDCSWYYIMKYILNKPLKDRIFPESLISEMDFLDLSCLEEYRLAEGNYLLFSIACRWISKITFVTHAKWREDLLYVYLKDNNPHSDVIQLRRYDPNLLSDITYSDLISQSNAFHPLEYEPAVIFEKINFLNFREDGLFSFIDLSCSPEYTPSRADNLINVIREYIYEI